jgi:hypothetical protein
MDLENKIYLIPFSRKEAMKFISDSKSSFDKLKIYKNDIDKLCQLTNFVPRYMKWLNKCYQTENENNITEYNYKLFIKIIENNYIKNTMTQIKYLSENYFKKLEENDKQLYLNAIKVLLRGEDSIDSFYVYDLGFFYQINHFSQPILISLIVQRVLTKIYVSNCNLSPVLENNLSDTDKGKLLEWHLILRELYGPVTLQCNYMGNTKTLPSPLKFEVQQVTKYESKQKGFIPFVPNFNLCTLYIPTLKNNFFQFIDHIIRKPDPNGIIENDLIIFNSATLPNILDHMYNSDSKKKFEFGEIEKFIDPNFNLIDDDYSEINFENCPTCNKKCTIDCILCDFCSFWYHFKCENITENENFDNIEFKCYNCKHNKNKFKKPLIVDILNSIYGLKDKTFRSRIIENENNKDTYKYSIISPNNNEMKNIIILYSCGRDIDKDNFRDINDNNIKPDPKKYINDFKITNIQYCTKKDHIEQLEIKYSKDQKNIFQISSIFEQFLDM